MSARDEFRPASANGMCTEAVWGPMCDEIDRLRATQHVDRDEIIGRLTIELDEHRERANRWAYKLTLLVQWVKTHCTEQEVAEARQASLQPPGPFANLLLTWDELDITCDCIEAMIAHATEVHPAFAHSGTLNSLRTAYREAQYQVQR